MRAKKYERLPFVIIDQFGQIWRRSKTRGWFEIKPYPGCNRSRYISHPDFAGCKKIMNRAEAEVKYPA